MNTRSLPSSLFVFSVLSVLGVTAPIALAQKYPAKPIRLISPFAPGGGTDILSRVIGPRISAVIGQPVVVDNRPGAGGALGAEIAAKSEPDGYTFITVRAVTRRHRRITSYRTIRSTASRRLFCSAPPAWCW